MKSFLLLISAIFITGCASATNSYNLMDSNKPACTGYMAFYSFSLQNVERPEKASQRYGLQNISTLTDDKKYKFYFEDELLRILWDINVFNMAFSLQNKTDHSIKIPWDEAAYVDENGRSHRVMHSGIKYTDREQSMPPSVIIRRGMIEDIVFPTDYIYWRKGSRYTAGSWEEKALFSPYLDIHCTYRKGDYPSFEAFDKAAKSKIGKTIQVLLPFQIKDVVNDYIFTFKIDSVSTRQESVNK